MHNECARFVIVVKSLFGKYFRGKEVLEIGSQNINGSVRFLFNRCKYTGIDIGPGKGVDYICAGHEWIGSYDVILNLEVAEHDEYYRETFQNCMKMLKPGGILIFTCAGVGRPEHGTRRTSLHYSPHTGDYYRNVSPSMILAIPGFSDTWEYYRFSVDDEHCDTQFVGIKKRVCVCPTPNIFLLIADLTRWFLLSRITDLKNAINRFL